MKTITHFKLSESDKRREVIVTYYAKNEIVNNKNIKMDLIEGTFKLGVKYPITSLRTHLQRKQG